MGIMTRYDVVVLYNYIYYAVVIIETIVKYILLLKINQIKI